MSDKGPDHLFQQTEEETGEILPLSVGGCQWHRKIAESIFFQHFSTHLMHTSRRKALSTGVSEGPERAGVIFDKHGMTNVLMGKMSNSLSIN